MITIWGIATRIRGLSETRDGSGRLECRSYDNLDRTLASTQITADHDPRLPVGEVVYGEIQEDGRVWLVGVVDDRVAQLDQPIFWSGEYVYRGPRAQMRGRHFIAANAQLTGVSLVLEPGSHSARRLQVRRGDIRDGADVSVWPGSWRNHDQLLARAEQHQLACRSARTIIDRRDTGNYPWLKVGDWVGGDSPRPGGVEHSGHRGSIISVR